MVNRGEHVILTSRMGRYRLLPMTEEEQEPKRDVTAEICRAMKDWKDYLDGEDTGKFRPADELIDELRNLLTIYDKADASSVKLNIVKQYARELGFEV